MNPAEPPPAEARAAHERLLLAVTGIPTATGKEQRVVDFITRWVAKRPSLTMTADDAGNLTVARAGATPTLYITAHLDHPAFVVEQLLGDPSLPSTLTLSFRGGVMDPYFKDARILVHTADGRRLPGTVIDAEAPAPLRRCTADLDAHVYAPAVKVGDIATWDLPEPRIEDGLLHAPVCDDLAALAAALCAFDAVLDNPAAASVALLFTRAEEVGFIGAIAASRNGSIPKSARLICLENSKASAEAPIGAGPIVRVGDRLWTFSPALTGAVAKAAEQLATAREKSEAPFKWQRKLMVGGACEATCFGAYGYESTCVCLPLGNYHNMANLDQVQAGDHSEAHIAPEHIAVADFHGLVDLLIACATGLADIEPLSARMDKLYDERSFVLER